MIHDPNKSKPGRENFTLDYECPLISLICKTTIFLDLLFCLLSGLT